MLSELEKAMANMIEAYHNYASLQGNHHALYKEDLKKLVNTECPQYVKNKNAKTLFESLDINEDKAVNFEEFLVLMIKVGVEAHRDSHKE
ncbi:protein S100-A8 [Meriones unguiculatus]|uniref:protein S100-A8 n=1 Tax=Meriones unguiculatus TaxID=10047 RepID=UPI000B4F148A|nr:protein S100-A8 [Meriones unguiculatus]